MDETLQASAEGTSRPSDKDEQAELPVAAVTRSQTGIEERSPRGGRPSGRRDDEEHGRRSHGPIAAGREVGGERVTASVGEQIKAGVNDKA